MLRVERSPPKNCVAEPKCLSERSLDCREYSCGLRTYKVKKHKGINDIMLVKIDLKKAYDRIEWEFMVKAFEALDFSRDVRKMI